MTKDAEIFDPNTREWNLLPGILAEEILTDDPEGPFAYRNDNYGWFFAWSDNTGAAPTPLVQR